jgi:hypothetical protein
VLGACWPLTKFWEFLGHVDLFWDFDKPVEGGAQDEAEIMGSRPPFGPLFGFLGICNGNGMSAHGFTHV